ncbi:MAG: hypothetical protein WDN44_14165 [Sphingomonas sp.]
MKLFIGLREEVENKQPSTAEMIAFLAALIECGYPRDSEINRGDKRVEELFGTMVKTPHRPRDTGPRMMAGGMESHQESLPDFPGHPAALLDALRTIDRLRDRARKVGSTIPLAQLLRAQSLMIGLHREGVRLRAARPDRAAHGVAGDLAREARPGSAPPLARLPSPVRR